MFGLVKSQPISLIFPNYLNLLSMYQRLIFHRRISTDGWDEWPGSNTNAKPWTGDTPTMGYMFGFLTIEDNTGASPEAVEQALEALGQVLHIIQS
jgi:hypothetical protein